MVPLSPEIIARITARVAAMDHYQRYDRAINMPENSEEADLEFFKLILGPSATEEDFMDMMDELMAAHPLPEENNA